MMADSGFLGWFSLWFCLKKLIHMIAVITEDAAESNQIHYGQGCGLATCKPRIKHTIKC